jgi:hypothetical protein
MEITKTTATTAEGAGDTFHRNNDGTWTRLRDNRTFRAAETRGSVVILNEVAR